MFYSKRIYDAQCHLNHRRAENFSVSEILASEHGSQMKLMEGDIGGKRRVCIEKFLRFEFAKKKFVFALPHPGFFLVMNSTAVFRI
jgi:hypothetical protein